jgi:hypothetical protein
MHPLTEYSPSWDISFGVGHWKDAEKIDTIREWLIENESRILDTVPLHHDGGTGLGENSVTSRFGRYNLLNFQDELPELAELLKFFRISYLDYVSQDNSEIRDVDIVCWFNKLKTGEHIKEHSHGAGNDAYLSGNIHLDNYATNTYYTNVFDRNVQFVPGNYKGGLSIFPSWVPHHTDEHKEDNFRLSIAFDLRLNDNAENKELHAIPFMNHEIYETLIKGL